MWAWALLPHHSRFARTQRTATAATIRVRQLRVRVYSTHLGTMADVEPASRRNQLRAILADAAPYERVVLGGDMNDVSVGQVAHLKGLETPDSGAAGTVINVRKASDHLPVWAVGVLR
jgi:endonuclease/exonuclease/phosphatase family metal-dependent hydrolase